MRNSTELKSELEKINARLDELKTQSAAQTNQFESAQAAFVAGKTSLDDSLQEQQKAALLESAIKSLEEKRESITAQLNQSLACEKRESILAEAKTLAAEAHDELKDYEKRRAALDDRLKTEAEALGEIFKNFAGKRNEVNRLLRAANPETEPAELTKKGLPANVYGEISRAVWHTSEPGYVNVVLSAVINKLAADERRRVIAESNQRRAETQARLRAGEKQTV